MKKNNTKWWKTSSSGIKLILVTLLMIFVTQEKFASNNNQNQDELLVEFYSIPAPDEILSYIHNSEIRFTPRLLHSVNKRNNYGTSSQKLLAYGSYMANLAYTMSFDQTNTGLQYFDIVDEMSRELNIFPPEVEELGRRLMENMNNMDSLNYIYDELFLLIIANLHDAERFGEYALISAGGFIESLHLALNSQGSKLHDDGLRMRVWDQKMIVDQLETMFKRYVNEPARTSVLNDMQGMIDAFNEFSAETEAPEVQQSTDGTIIIGGAQPTDKTVNSINRIHQEVNKLREKWGY